MNFLTECILLSQIVLLDFGATREYDKTFVDEYFKVYHKYGYRSKMNKFFNTSNQDIIMM